MFANILFLVISIVSSHKATFLEILLLRSIQATGHNITQDPCRSVCLIYTSRIILGSYIHFSQLCQSRCDSF